MNSVSLLRLFTFVEGISYLLLVLVAMPLKYVFDLPLAVRIAGGLHGFLFIAFVLTLLRTHAVQNWTKGKSLSLLLASLVPGSLFWLDRRIREPG